MKNNLAFPILLGLLIAAATPAANATTFFTDNFSNGSTTNLMSNPGGTPTASFTSYDIASQKNTFPNANPTNGVIIYPGGLNLRLAAPTTSGWLEAQALFTTNAVSLNNAGDYIDLIVVFTNQALGVYTNGSLLAAGTSSFLGIGLFNSGASVGVSNPPVAGGLAQSGLSTATGSTNATGFCANWWGYVAQVYSNGTSRIITRPVQNGAGTTSANQDTIALGAGSGAWNNPNGTNVVSAPANTSVILASNGTYTLELTIKLSAVSGGTNFLSLTNKLYEGAGIGGTVVYQLATNNIPAIATSFDGLTIGVASRGISWMPCMDLSLIQITGSVSAPVPPVIGSQPGSVLVASNGACAFFVTATGNSLSYQWKRNGTNLLNQGNISGVTSSTLVITNAGTQDALPTNSGYCVIVSGANNLSVISTTNALTLIPATNLVWSGTASAWDLNNTADWYDPGSNPQVFSFGDPVVFDDTGINNGTTIVTLSGAYLSASSVTVSQNAGFGSTYTFTGSGTFAGPGNLVYNGSGQLNINNANDFTGGTIISNANAYLQLGNQKGLGTGPITMAMAGGQMEIVPSGSTIASDLNVQDNFTIITDATNTSTGLVLNGELSGTATKTLTISHNPNQTIGTNATRIRINGSSTVYDANLVLGVSGDTNIVWSPSSANGSQTYNGVISGPGGFLQKLATAYLNNSLNTYSGGTIPAAGAIGLGASSVGSPTVASGPIGTGPLLLVNDSTTSFNTTAAVFASGGARTVANLIQYAKATNNLSLIFAGTNDLTLSGAFSLQGNDGGAGAGTNRTIQVTNLGASTLSGVISDGGQGIGLVKSGPGSLYLNGNNTYAGLTTISNLSTSGGIGLLAGSGTIAGSVLVQTNAAIGGGASGTSIGTLTISGSLTNNGNVFARLNKSLTPARSNDFISVTGTLTNTGTGTVIVTNIGPAIAVGDKFFLFNKAVSNSASLNIIGGGISWNNNLAVDGSITAVAAADVSAQIAGPASIAQGGTANYTLTFSNSGPGIATGVAATDLLLSTNVTFVSASNGGATNTTANPRLVVWGAFTLVANTATNFTVTVNGGSVGSVTNTTSVTTVSFDTNTANNSATNVTSVVLLADVGVLKTGPASVTVGSTTNYTLTVSNAGPSTATGILVTDTMPASVTFVSASGGGVTNTTANPKLVVWGPLSLAANAATALTLTVNAASVGNATNTVIVASAVTDPNPANNSATNVMVITSSSIIPTIPASITSFSIVGTDVQIGGTNGVNGGIYYLLDSTDAALPFLQWVARATNVVTASGGSASFTFTGTNVVTPNGAQQFYILSNTNNH